MAFWDEAEVRVEDLVARDGSFTVLGSRGNERGALARDTGSVEVLCKAPIGSLGHGK